MKRRVINRTTMAVSQGEKRKEREREKIYIFSIQ